MHPISNTGVDADQSAAYQHPHKLKIDQIRIDGGTQPRVDINQEAVARYEQDLKLGATFPPVPVFFDGTTYWAAGGFHRILAHTRFGATEIDVEVSKGTVEDARWFSYAENQGHGLQRSNKDIERAVTAALGHPRSAEMSARAIAEYLGVDDHTVAAWKKKISGAEVPHLPELEPGVVPEPAAKVTGRDGKKYPGKRPDSLNIGRGGDKPQRSDTPHEDYLERTSELFKNNEPATTLRGQIDSLLSACYTIINAPSPPRYFESYAACMRAAGKSSAGIYAQVAAEWSSEAQGVELLRSRFKPEDFDRLKKCHEILGRLIYSDQPAPEQVKLPRLPEGAHYLPGFLTLAEQKELVEMCRGYTFRHQTNRRYGRPLKKSKVDLGRQLGNPRYADGVQGPNLPVPQFFKDLGSRIATKVGMSIDADVVQIQHYPEGTGIALHQDTEESDSTVREGTPVVSISLGDDAMWLFGGSRRDDPCTPIRFRSGDVFVWGGPARGNFHGIEKIYLGSGSSELCPLIPSLGELGVKGRINIAIRKS